MSVPVLTFFVTAKSMPKGALGSERSVFPLLDFLGGRAYSALPCAGAPPPQRPLSYNLAS